MGNSQNESKRKRFVDEKILQHQLRVIFRYSYYQLSSVIYPRKMIQNYHQRKLYNLKYKLIFSPLVYMGNIFNPHHWEYNYCELRFEIYYFLCSIYNTIQIYNLMHLFHQQFTEENQTFYESRIYNITSCDKLKQLKRPTTFT